MTEAMLCRALTDNPVSEQRIILDSAKSTIILETRTPFKIFAKKSSKKRDLKDSFQHMYNFISLCLVGITISLSQKSNITF